MFKPVRGRPVRVGLIGTGGIAEAHADCYHLLSDEAELVAICEIVPERAAAFAQRFGVKATYADYREVIARDDIDMIDICTPPLIHAEIMLAALRAGKPALSEKPLVASLQELDTIVATAHETGLFTACISQLRWGNGLRQVRALQEQGILGDPLWGLCETAWFRDDAYYAAPWRGRWENEVGGTTLGHGVHAIDTFLTVMGKPASITATIGTLNHAIQVEDTSAAVVRFENGALATTFNTTNCHRQFTRLVFGFRNATAESSETPYLMTEAPFTITAQDEELQRRILAFQAGWQPDRTPGAIYCRQIAEFLAAMRGERPPTVTGMEARKAMELITGLYKAAFTGAQVDFPITASDPFYASLHGGYATPAGRAS